MVFGDDFAFDYRMFKEKHKPTKEQKAEKEQTCKKTIKLCKDEIDLFKL